MGIFLEWALWAFSWFIFPLGEFVSLCFLYDLYSHLGICIMLLIVWFILPIGKFVTFCSSYDLYSRLENLYHFARRMIYIPTWRICNILLVIWFIFPLGEFVSFCLSYDLYSHLENLYDFFLERLLTLCCFGPSWGHFVICIKQYMRFPKFY